MRFPIPPVKKGWLIAAQQRESARESESESPMKTMNQVTITREQGFRVQRVQVHREREREREREAHTHTDAQTHTHTHTTNRVQCLV